MAENYISGSRLAQHFADIARSRILFALCTAHLLRLSCLLFFFFSHYAQY
jgi:hypothetical protein